MFAAMRKLAVIAALAGMAGGFAGSARAQAQGDAPAQQQTVLSRIQTIVGTGSLQQPVLAAAELNELPHPDGLLVGTGTRQEARFHLREVDQFLWHAFVVENALDQRAKASRAAQAP